MVNSGGYPQHQREFKPHTGPLQRARVCVCVCVCVRTIGTENTRAGYMHAAFDHIPVDLQVFLA